MRTRWRVTTTAAVVFSGILAVAGAAPALAQPGQPGAAPAVSDATKDAARNSYRAAELKLKEGNYALALEYYGQAEAILPVSATKYKIAMCHDRLGHTADAIKWYQAFLASSPPPKMADSVTDARARLAVLAQVVLTGQVHVTVVPSNAPRLSVTVDGGPPQSVAAALTASPGRHRLVIQADGFAPSTVDVDIVASGTREVQVQLVPAALPGPIAVQPARTRRSNVPSLVLFGVTGVGVVIGGIFGGLALGAKNSFNSHPHGDTTDANNAQTDSRVADASFGVAIVAGVVGLVLILTNPPRPASTGDLAPPSHRAFVSPYAGPSGVGLSF